MVLYFGREHYILILKKKKISMKIPDLGILCDHREQGLCEKKP